MNFSNVTYFNQHYVSYDNLIFIQKSIFFVLGCELVEKLRIKSGKNY